MPDMCLLEPVCEDSRPSSSYDLADFGVIHFWTHDAGVFDDHDSLVILLVSEFRHCGEDRRVIDEEKSLLRFVLWV